MVAQVLDRVAHTSHMLTIQEAKEALVELVEALGELERSADMVEARRLAGNDMLRSMQLVYPLQCRCHMRTIARHGFSDDAEGLVRFAQAVGLLARESDAVDQLNKTVRRMCIPPLVSQS